MEMARIATNMTETRFVCDFVFAFALFVCASLRNATFRIASVRIASVRNASLQIEKPTLRQRSSKCRGRLVETHARMHHRFLAVRVLREVRSSCELPLQPLTVYCSCLSDGDAFWLTTELVMLCSSPMSCQLNHLVLTKTVSSREKAGSLSSEIVRISSLFVRIGAATAADSATAAYLLIIIIYLERIPKY